MHLVIRSSLSESALVFLSFLCCYQGYIPRDEFPGLKASPNWVLTDAAGGTQVEAEPQAKTSSDGDFSGQDFFRPRIFQAKIF